MSNQSMDFAKQHQYAREKEKADKVLARYDVLLKIVLGFGAGLFLPLLFVVLILISASGFSVGTFFFLLIVIGGIVGTIWGAIQIRKRKSTHQAKLDAQIVSSLS